MALLASAQLVVVVIVLRWYPETAHQELEALNPEDAASPARDRLTAASGCRRRRRRVHGRSGANGGADTRRRPVTWAMASVASSS